jgi:hypothetical protein
MAETVTYIAVMCKTKDCGNRIELMPLTIVEGRARELPLLVGPIAMDCDKCGQTHWYSPSDQIHFDGPAPPRSS